MRRPLRSPLAPRSSSRRAITLYEVVVSLAILLVSLAALGQLIATGSRAAAQSRLKTEATLLCRSKLSEIVAGVEPMQPLNDMPFAEAGPEWSWSLAVAAGPHADLLDLDLTVNHLDETNEPDASSSLRLLVRNPQVFADAAAIQATLDAQSAEEDATQ